MKITATIRDMFKNMKVTANKKDKYIGLVLLVVVLLVLGRFAYDNRTISVDARDIVKITVDGINGHGFVETSVVDDNLKHLERRGFLGGVDVKTSYDDRLSNGDTIEVSVSCNRDFLERYNISLKNKTFTYEVNGLSDGKSIDVFEGVEVSIAGISSEASATVSSTTDYVTPVYYSLDKSEGISNGDTLVIQAAFDEKEFARNGQGVLYKTKEYVVDGLEHYLTSSEDLNNDNLLLTYNAALEDSKEFLEKEMRFSEATYRNFDDACNKVLLVKYDNTVTSEKHSCLIFVMSGKLTTGLFYGLGEDLVCDTYAIAYLNDPIVKTNGRIVYDKDNFDFYLTDNVNKRDAYIDELSEDVNVESITEIDFNY